MQEQNPRGKRWVFTWCNYPENWRDIITNGKNPSLWSSDNIKYLVAEKEYAPTTGMAHIQGYFELNTKFYRNSLYMVFLPAYLQIAKGTQLDNYKYCTKTGVDVIEIGSKTLETEKWCTRLIKTKNMLNDLMKTSWSMFSEKYPVEALHNRNQLVQWKFDHTEVKESWSGLLAYKNIWLWGAPGTGKSTWARKQMEANETMFKLQNKWWDGYDDYHHKLVIIEDLEKNYAKVLVSHLKVWSDRHWFSGEIKGGAIKVNPGKFFLIVTSNYSIDDCFENEEDKKAIKRRFKEVEIKTPNDIFLGTMLDKTILTT